MKSILSSLVLSACCVPLVMGAAQVAAAFNATATSHKFANLNAPLWTNTPIQIDRTNQPYERLPAILAASTETIGASQSKTDQVAEARPSTTPDDRQTAMAAIEHARVARCQNRYTSYRAEDDTYQPFGGGPRHACEAPQSLTGGALAETSRPQVTNDLGEAHVRWCSDHFSSYQAADNSYRAFSGARRQCASPFAGTRSNSLHASM
ncbi:BA14K family protein [Agrobacterium vitis]|uniref:BA14K family protein n=1 Tax=Rhizobium/Agrobacterium group TaxID=227290 RepID=UPI0012E729B3|nr:BA14K family protein [Allorhizobium ampelinum]MCF1485527.1 BA14K family protein [Allorhizobium ampelinum]MVA74355.1 hypothetical protein [Agrobacterium vitis]